MFLNIILLSAVLLNVILLSGVFLWRLSFCWVLFCLMSFCWVLFAECHFAECCFYGDCHFAKCFMLIVLVMRVTLLTVILLSFGTLNVLALSKLFQVRGSNIFWRKRKTFCWKFIQNGRWVGLRLKIEPFEHKKHFSSHFIHCRSCGITKFSTRFCWTHEQIFLLKNKTFSRLQILMSIWSRIILWYFLGEWNLSLRCKYCKQPLSED
jgi:hypothetical protein